MVLDIRKVLWIFYQSDDDSTLIYIQFPVFLRKNSHFSHGVWNWNLEVKLKSVAIHETVYKNLAKYVWNSVPWWSLQCLYRYVEAIYISILRRGLSFQNQAWNTLDNTDQTFRKLLSYQSWASKAHRKDNTSEIEGGPRDRRTVVIANRVKRYWITLLPKSAAPANSWSSGTTLNPIDRSRPLILPHPHIDVQTDAAFPPLIDPSPLRSGKMQLKQH